MKATHTGLIILSSFLALCVGCTKVVPNAAKLDKTVTVQAGGTLGCEVDYPVAVVYKSKYYPRWVSADNEYWVHFTDPGNPFAPGNDPIDVPPHGKSQQLAITVPDAEIPQGGKYYKYEIWNQYNSATNAHTKCKDADDDHDTGLNIKR